MKNQELLLYHELMLLALKDREGTPVSNHYPYALSTAVLSELVLRNRITIGSSFQKAVSVVDSTPTGIMLLDKCLKKIAAHEEQKPLIHWVKKAIDLIYLPTVVIRELCDFGILKRDEKQLLWSLSRTTYPELDPHPEQQLKKRLRHLLLDEPIEEELTPESYERTTVVAILAQAAQLLDANLGTLSLQRSAEKLGKLSEDSNLGNAAKLLSQAIQSEIAIQNMIQLSVIAAASG